MTQLKTTSAHLKRLWRAYLESTRHSHAYDQSGECECGKLCGDW